eukprot:CAMPEP_0196762386 /NCGR_PEP_ID=MMETSP1095-20130614/1811_1 /TAXON_ID=96789 ORGANISM="Chromulina nebulosa, Strain UTEXLB2642" /NCGR_SAMPLE_ID=MMETSP1095 /ASSEMBLY_ACC=CAM_ASM_000446 /LENGTH=374 /DNA_ID=CAMNT_0042113125 /DNA_START=53 /DNA_END=1174 /DNA_ORIENTATION=+
MPPNNTDKIIGNGLESSTNNNESSLSSYPASLTKFSIQIDDSIYPTEAIAQIHPGGDLFVKAFSGLDATEAFLSYHRRSFPHDKLTRFKLGTTIPRKNIGSDKEFLELCEIVEKILPKHKSYAPLSYYIKALGLVGAAVGIEIYMHYTGNYKWYLSAPLGLVMALIGMNIQHDANHGALSRNPIVNRIFGYTQNLIGGSAVDWIHQHVVQHHVNTNDVHSDPDIVGNVILRLNPLKPMTRIHGLQHLYVFILIALFGFTVIEYSMENVIRGEHHIPMSQLLIGYRAFDIFTSILFIFRWFVLPYILWPCSLSGVVERLINIAPMFMVGGYYLAFFFLISHNFKGVHMFDKTELDRDESFLRSQVSSSSNVGGSW